MRQHDSFSNSGLGRVKPKKHVFHSFINNKLKRQRSQIGLVEDSTSSTTIVRIIIGLLMLHLVIIGGVLLKGHFDKIAGGVAVSPTVTPPPVAAPVEEVLPQPVVPSVPAVAAAPAATPEAPAAPAGTHITQPSVAADVQPELFPEEEAPVVVTPPVVATAPAAPVETAPAAPAVEMTTIKHLVSSGDTWYGLAQKYGTTMDALKAANPAAARKSHLYQGSYVNVPVPAGSAAAQASAPAENAAAAEEAKPTMYTVKRGDTLGKIARKHKTSVSALMQLNGFTEKDSRRIKVGQQIRVSK